MKDKMEKSSQGKVLHQGIKGTKSGKQAKERAVLSQDNRLGTAPRFTG